SPYARTAQYQSCGPLAEELGKGLPRGGFKIGNTGKVRLDEPAGQVASIAIRTPAQEQVGRPPMAMTAPMASRIVVGHHQAVALGSAQKGTDAVIEVAPTIVVQVFRQVSQSLVEPRFLVAPLRLRQVFALEVLAEHDRMCVLMRQQGA